MYHTLNTNIQLSPCYAVSLRCPHCRREGVFGPPALPDLRDLAWGQSGLVPSQPHVVAAMTAGMRVCPNRDCRGLLFVVRRGHDLHASFPAEVIDFDATALPAEILASLEEAVACHAAGAYRACALMVRRVLEELCVERGADGKNLKVRLQNLGANVVVPSELLDAADELRLLGNDAAHIEAKSYDAVGQDEAGLAVELAKELLKAVYQYQSLVDRLRGLKKAPIKE